MSQRKEKYIRGILHRLDRLEAERDKTTVDAIAQSVSVAALSEFVERVAADKSADAERVRRDRRTAEAARRRDMHQLRIAAAILFSTIGIMAFILTTIIMRSDMETADYVEVPALVATIPVKVMLSPAPDMEGEDPMEAEKIEAALLEQGYFSEKVPMPYDLQDVMQTQCEQWGCPYALALAVAEVESQFNMDAVGAIGEVGIMQINPGPGGAYHDALEAETGQDPTTTEGNIACGVYLLGKYMTEYDDITKTAMAYSMGETAAKKAWTDGIASTSYAAAVVTAMEGWKCTIRT